MYIYKESDPFVLKFKKSCLAFYFVFLSHEINMRTLCTQHFVNNAKRDLKCPLICKDYDWI